MAARPAAVLALGLVWLALASAQTTGWEGQMAAFFSSGAGLSGLDPTIAGLLSSSGGDLGGLLGGTSTQSLLSDNPFATMIGSSPVTTQQQAAADPSTSPSVDAQDGHVVTAANGPPDVPQPSPTTSPSPTPSAAAATTTAAPSASTALLRSAQLLAQLGQVQKASLVLFAFPHLADLVNNAFGFNLTAWMAKDHELLEGGVRAMAAAEAAYCTEPQVFPGEDVPTGCTGSQVVLSIQGGWCELQEDKSVVCKKPSVVVYKTPKRCYLKYTTPTRVVGKECKLQKFYGPPPSEQVLKAPVLKTFNLTLDDIAHGHFNLTQNAPSKLQSMLSGLQAWKQQHSLHLPQLHLGQMLQAWHDRWAAAIASWKARHS